MSAIIFWQNIPSIHQAPLLREVAKKWPGEVAVVAEQDLSCSRLEQGWSSPEFSPAKLVVSPTLGHQVEFLEKSGRDTFHIFSGFHAYPGTYNVFKMAVRKRLNVAVFVEPGHTGSFTDILRLYRYRLHAMNWNKHINFLLATGQLGVNYYRKSGFQTSKIFPFAYFVEQGNIMKSAPDQIDSNQQVTAPFSLLFVGQLNHNKGLDILFFALSQFQNSNWTLNVVGRGPDQDKLMRYAHKLNISERINWLGILPNERTRLLMGKSDCLVLPSRYDGWGAVVNEALMAGTSVVVSDACGSCDLVRTTLIGDVFPTGSPCELATVLELRISKGHMTLSDRSQICTWADKVISPSRGAQYLIDIIKFYQDGETGQRPNAPWRKTFEQPSH